MIGIKPEFQEKVFEPFKRLHTKEIPGSGLGLAMCRKILRAHRGESGLKATANTGRLLSLLFLPECALVWLNRLKLVDFNQYRLRVKPL